MPSFFAQCMTACRFAPVILAITLFTSTQAFSEPRRALYQSGDNYLLIEVLDDQLLHMEYGRGTPPSLFNPIPVSPMISASNLSGPAQFWDRGAGGLETRDLRLDINRADLSVTIFDQTKNGARLTTLKPSALNTGRPGLEGYEQSEFNVYGLGQQFIEPGNSDRDWSRRVREGGTFGNDMLHFNAGANGNTQIPIAYFVKGASGLENYALFLDNPYRHRWDFTPGTSWKVETSGGALRFFVLTGTDLPALRKSYMRLVGHPLVPPRKMFGLWMSEYGYDDWNELEEKLRSLRAKEFPLDGFVLDLQWFGNVQSNSDFTRMGSLTWDTRKFPNPAQKIAELREREGAGIMLIEEAYIGRGLPEHANLQGRGCLARKCGTSDATYLDGNTWWGKGGLFDYSNGACSDFWHDWKRQALIRDGIIGHWTDLGEPEMYSADSCYAGGTHPDVHNLFNFKWLESIHRGYARNRNLNRPFMMSRSGAAGIQRFGAAMWSGDIAGRLSSLASHAANQMHMSLSGIDYYGSDIGGFHRNLEGDLHEMYTRWFAYGMLFDIPGRPHTENLCNCKETAPDRIGDFRSNLANARLRYELIPYLYSLAHRAHGWGDPVLPPLVYYYQTDANVRTIGHEKLLGRDLLAAISARHGETETEVYLPEGGWYDWYTHTRVDHSSDQPSGFASGTRLRAPLFRDGLFRLPLYARSGAIIPMQKVDSKTMNALGKRTDGSMITDLMVKVFASPVSSEFTLYEDDGQTNSYLSGQVRQTRILQRQVENQARIQILGARGNYAGAPPTRNRVVQLVATYRARPALATRVLVNGSMLPQLQNIEGFQSASSGWVNDRARRAIWIKTGSAPVEASYEIAVDLQETLSTCTSQYFSVSVPGDGNAWNPADSSRNLQCIGNKVWKGQVRLCRERFKFAANGSWDRNWGSNGVNHGPNFPPLDRSGIYEITFDEDHPSSPAWVATDLSPSICPIGP